MNFNDVEHALSGDNSESPGTRFGLKFDPLAYLFGKKYRDLINKTGDKLNSTLAPIQKKVNKFDRKINPLHRAIDRTELGGQVKQWVENKPGSTMGLVYGGGAAYSGLAGGSGAGGSDLGIFSNGGTSGMGGVGGGNAGALANAGGIEGGAGMGSATEGGAAFDWQSLAKQGLQQSNPQQQQRAAAIRGQSAELEHERQKADAAEAERRRLFAAAMQAPPMYSPV